MTRKIVVPLDSPAIARGVGFFETLLVARGRPIFLREHFERMESGMRSIDLPAPELDLFDRAARKEARKVADLKEASVRLSWLAIGSDLDDHASWKLVALAGSIPAATMMRRRKGRVIILGHHLGRTSPELKSVSYMPTVLGLREAARRNADEALFTNENGGILEGTTSNVFAIHGDTIYTPPVSAGLLPGIMRRWIVENAGRLDLGVKERLLTKRDLLVGSFLTGSLTKICPIRYLDGKKCVLPGPKLKRLERLFENEVAKGSTS